jgi:hypothetical protein
MAAKRSLDGTVQQGVEIDLWSSLGRGWDPKKPRLKRSLPVN